jgi:hypothetical protein
MSCFGGKLVFDPSGSSVGKQTNVIVISSTRRRRLNEVAGIRYRLSVTCVTLILRGLDSRWTIE